MWVNKKCIIWPSNKSDLRPHHDRHASSRPSRPIRESIGIKSGPRTTTTARPNFKSDLRPIYDCAEWYTRQPSELRPTCKDLRPKEDPAVSWVTRKWNWQVPRPFLTINSDFGGCRFQWLVGQSFCEYPGVTYDLLVSNIRGAYDLADQRPLTTSLAMFWS